MSHSSALDLSLARSACFCWVLRVQGFHNSHCKRTDALVVRPGLRVCLALMALSHGPKLTCSGFNFWLNPLSGFPPVSFFQLADTRFWLKCQEPLVFAEILWVVFFVFFYSSWQSPGCLSRGLTDLWFLFCVMHYIFLLYRLQNLVYFFVCVDPAPRQHRREKRIREYKQHVSIWKMCFFAWGISLLISALLWSRWKYLNKYWTDYHEILHSV